MKKHRLFITLVTAVLIVATLEVTSPQLAVASPPALQQVDNAHPQGIGCIFAILILVIGVVILWGLYQLCKKIPPPPPPNNGQPTNITVASYVVGPDRFMQFQFEYNTNSPFIVAGSAQDELGNEYQLQCSYQLLCSSNPAGPWTLDALVTNWLGGNVQFQSNTCVVSAITNQEIALYDTNGNLLSARRWAVTTNDSPFQPRIVMPPMHLPEQFYRLVLLDQ